MPLDEKDIPPKLIESYLEEKCGFFVGAGLSIGAGFPDWKGLLLDLIDRAETGKMLTQDAAKECREHVEDPSKFLMVAEELKDVLVSEFKAYIEEIFGNEAIAPLPIHDLLVSLNKNKFIITTNYDLLIEKSFAKAGVYQSAYKFYEAHAIQAELFRRKFFLLKAHGDAKTAADKIVMTEKDYRRLFYQEPGYQSALQSIFTMYSVIFIGCSLKDPEVKLLLNYINAAFPEGGTPHYALMTEDSTGEIERNRWRKDFNIQIIPISSKNNYEDLNVFLEILKDKEN